MTYPALDTMKRLLTLFALCMSVTAAPAADLLAVYQRALQNDPQLREAEANRLASLEAKPQALSALLPQLAGSAAVSREHDTASSTITQPLSSPHGPVILQTYPSDGRIVTTTHKYGIDLRQNLFRWENWVALQRADAQVAPAGADYQAAQQDLMERVAQRYFDVLAAQDDREAQQLALTSIQRQLDQAESRFQIGLIAITDVEEARAAHDSGAAAVIAAKRTLASTLELLREITGDPFDGLARPIEPFELANPDPVNEDRWVDMALQQNLSLVSSRLAVAITRDSDSAARGLTHPSPHT